MYYNYIIIIIIVLKIKNKSNSLRRKSVERQLLKATLFQVPSLRE